MAGLTCTPWCTPTDLPDALQEGAEGACQAASDILYAASGRRWRGTCTREGLVIEVCPGTGPSWRELRRIVLGTGPGVGRRPTYRIALPDYPVTAVASVAEQRLPTEAVELDGSEWRLVNGRWLERLADGQRVAWVGYDLVVSYTYGQGPPDGGVRAAVEYASQLQLAAAGDGACQLPKRVQSITRQGVTMAFLDPGDYLDQGRTGVPSVDQWLASVNPGGLRQRPRVWSPDTDRTTTRYGT